VKPIFIFLVFVFCAASAFGQRAVMPWWHSLEQGKFSFRNGDYGRALMLFEDARRDRRAKFEQMERDLINFLSLPEVRRLGDSLDWAESFANQWGHTAAAAAFRELFFRVPKESLGNSVTRAVEAIGRLREYPEAEFWIGEVFRVEGELALALAQYRRAYQRRELFGNPGFVVDLLYQKAEVLRIRQDFIEMESVLLSIIYYTDALWADASAVARRTGPSRQMQAEASFAVQAMSRTLENEGPNRFLFMHRYTNPRSEEAHRRLGLFYAASGRPSAMPHLMFAFLIQNSTIIDEMFRRQFDFAFTNLSDLAREINRIPMLVQYTEERQYFKTAYFLADSLFRRGRLGPARELWTFLAEEPRAGEWHSRSIAQLRNPRLEPIVQMP